MNNFQKHISKMTKAELYYEGYCEEITSFYKTRNKLRNWSRVYKDWKSFKKFSEWVRD